MTVTTMDRPVAAEWTALGCIVRLVVTDPSALPEARRLLDEELAALDLACSRFRPDSELARVDAAHGAAVRVSPLLAEAVAAALRAARITDGDVDPTLGAAMAAAGYDRDFSLVLPDGPRVRLSRPAEPAWPHVVLDETALTLTVPDGVQLDLGATAKAYGADRAAARIAGMTGTGVLVGLGGDIAVAGPPPPGGWSIQVQDVTTPTAAADDVAADVATHGQWARIAITTGGIATSSISARRWVRGGRIMHHILDPRSGAPVAPVWRTVTVAADSCLDANIASTASIVRGAAAAGWLSRLGLPARLVGVEGDVTTVAGWPGVAS